MSITLKWVGPYGFGHFSELRQYPYASDPHVYVRVQTFRSRKIAAVGQAANLSSRINEHLRDFLSRQCCLSDDAQTHNYRPAGGPEGLGLAVFDSLDDWLGAAVAEVRRFRFFAAPCESEKLPFVGAELIDRLWNAAEGSGGRIERDHWKKEAKLPSGELILKYEFSTPGAKGVLEFVPEVPVSVPETQHTETETPALSLGPDVYTYSAPGLPMCPECGERPAIFYCSSHQRAVCLECVARHDERGQCVYVPGFRAPKPAAVEAITPGPSLPPGAAKPRSVLGID